MHIYSVHTSFQSFSYTSKVTTVRFCNVDTESRQVGCSDLLRTFQSTASQAFTVGYGPETSDNEKSDLAFVQLSADVFFLLRWVSIQPSLQIVSAIPGSPRFGPRRSSHAESYTSQTRCMHRRLPEEVISPPGSLHLDAFGDEHQAETQCPTYPPARHINLRVIPESMPHGEP
jgi:hypothetical protein